MQLNRENDPFRIKWIFLRVQEPKLMSNLKTIFLRFQVSDSQKSEKVHRHHILSPKIMMTLNRRYMGSLRLMKSLPLRIVNYKL